MSDIMQKDGHLGGLTFFFGNLYALAGQDVEGLLHKVHGSQGMVEPGMNCPGINQLGQAQLTDVPHALQKRVLNKAEHQLILYRDEPVYRIINDFIFIHGPERTAKACSLFYR